jgi:imidazolonepropionase-like amidohydrolase
VAGFALHGDLQNMVKAGLSPYQAMVAATANPGSFAKAVLKRPKEGGTISPGSPADLVLLDANPLDDITRTTGIRGVMVRGRWLTRDDLDRMLNQLVRANGATGT